MHRFWERVTYPIFIEMKPKKIVEIGVFRGENTEKILQYCQQEEAHLIAIDTETKDMSISMNSNFLTFIKGLSLDVLPTLSDYDAILIDGDHNWYTVYHELKIVEKFAIENGKFPLIMLHDTAPPFARRDMYYDMSTIPSEFLQPHRLTKEAGEYDVINEGGERNGVLTAVEDFLKETSLPYSFKNLQSNNGLGIITPTEVNLEERVTQIIVSSGM